MPRPKPIEEKKCRTLRLTDREYEFMKAKGVPGLRRMLETDRIKRYRQSQRDAEVLAKLHEGATQRRIQIDLGVSNRVVSRVTKTMWRPVMAQQ